MNDNAKPNTIPATATTAGVVMAVVGIGLTALGMGSGMQGLAAPWIYGALFWACVSFGCIGLNLLFQATRGRWGTPLVRIFEAGGGVLHLALSFVTLFVVGFMVFGQNIYGGWLQMPASDQILQNKAWYLNQPFFIVRSVIYFGALAALAHFFKTWTNKEEQTGDIAYHKKRANLSGIGLVIFFVIMTFLTTDYAMSIDPHWYSTIWGVWFCVGAALAAMSLGVFLVITNQEKEPYAGKIDNLMKNDFGNLLLMLTMLWGYFSFSQLLIIWSGNLPEFTTFYLARLRGGFSTLGSVLFFGQFLLPFMTLLSPSAKRSKTILLGVVALIFILRVFDLYWIIFPFFRTTFSPQPGDFGPLLLIGGVWMGLFGLNARQSSLYVPAHPYQEHTTTMNLTEAEANG